LLLGNYRELKQHGDALFPTPAFLQAMHERYGRIVRVWCGPLWTGVGSLALSFLDPVDGLELLEKAPHRAPRDVLDGPFAGRDVQALRASCDAAVATPEAARAAHRATVAAMTRATANWPNAAVDAEAELGVIVYDVLGEVLLKLPPAAASPLAARLRGLHLSVRQEAAAFAARWVAPFWSPAYREHLQVGLATGRRRLTRCGGWQAVQALRRVCAQVVEERVSAVRASPGSFAGDRSALTLLATDAGLDQAQAAAAVLGLMHGAYDATLAALVWGLFHLAKHPSAQAALQKELDGHIGRRLAPAFDELARLPYLHACVQESLRLKPSFPSIHRVNYGQVRAQHPRRVKQLTARRLQDMFVGKPWSNEDDDFFGEVRRARGGLCSSSSLTA
jgi:cytochrome P450